MRNFAGLLMLALAGCSSTASTPTGGLPQATVSPELVAAGEHVALLTSIPSGTTSLGVVTAIPCAVYLTAPQPTDELAIAMLKAEVAKKGGDGISGIQMVHLNVELSRNCYTTINATAEAYKLR